MLPSLRRRCRESFCVKKRVEYRQEEAEMCSAILRKVGLLR
jgi:hypothetical protein